jgi:hypothetical protein
VARFLFLFIYLKKKQKKVKEESDTKQMSDERFPTQSISLFHVYVKPNFSFDYFVFFFVFSVVV